MTVTNTVHILNTADWQMPEGMMMQMGGNDLVTAKCPAYLIEHPESLILFDTGLSHDLVANPTDYGAPQLEDFAPAIEPEATPAEQIDDLGYDTSDVDHIVLSHLHTDHAGNIDQFKDANIHIHIDELRYAWWPDPPQAAFYVDSDLTPLRESSGNITEVACRTDLLGDGSIEIIPTPGHTPGHQSLKVKLDGETVYLVADVANLRAGYEEGLVAPFSWSTEKSMESLRRLKAEVSSHDAFTVIHHDREDLSRLDD
jgi:N-acyl homoserine lactone hydrolase